MTYYKRDLSNTPIRTIDMYDSKFDQSAPYVNYRAFYITSALLTTITIGLLFI